MHERVSSGADRGHPVEDRCDPALIAVLRRQTPAAKLAALDALWRSGVALVRSGVAARHPEWTEAMIAAEAARIVAGATDSPGGN